MVYKDYLQIFEKRKDVSKLFRYYRGEHDAIRERRYKKGKPSNRLVNAFPSYITNVNIGYFLGRPVRYTSIDEIFIQELQDIFNYSDEQDENIALARLASIAGTAYEIVYLDEDSNICFNEVSPENMVLLYDDKIVPEPELAIRGWKYKSNFFMDVYDKENIQKYKDGKLIEMVPHYIQDVPVIEFPNNDDRKGDFEKALGLIDAYDQAQSDSANDFEYFADAYLKLRNLSATTSEDIDKMRQDRTIKVDGDGDADWLIKQMNDMAIENYKNRLQEDIHRFSQTPNLTDESFAGNASGVALNLKLLGMEWNVAVKERKFKRALQRRIELICNVMNLKGKNWDWRDVEIAFSRNQPQNQLEVVELAMRVKGAVSDDTFLSLLPFIYDPSNELEKIAEEGKYTLDDDEQEERIKEQIKRLMGNELQD